MILVIRISGLVEVPTEVNEALFRMRLRRKYTAVLIKPTPENKKLLQMVRNFVAFGPIDDKTLSELVSKRGIPIPGKKPESIKTIDQLDKKSLEDFNLKPYFRLHPPRGGIDSKLHFPMKKGVLGDNKEKINDLVRRML